MAINKTLLRVTSLRVTIALVTAIALLVGAVVALNSRGEARLPVQSQAFSATPQQIEHGAYLARAGNCSACHTARGGAPFAGGSGINTPFGTVYSTNLTPDGATGIGKWSADEFWRAMHNGRSRDGRLLYPAFPYTNYTFVTRPDSDALYAYFRSQRPVIRVNTAHALRFPYNLQASLAVWRALFFKPSDPRADRLAGDSTRSAEWLRGSYLVRGLGHCSACHGTRNLFGATSESLELSGGLIPMQNWYAPSFTSADEASVADWSPQQVIALLKTGKADRASVLGPMAEVVFRSTQHLTDTDLRAMAVFLMALPQSPAVDTAELPEAKPANTALVQHGAKLYDRHCADCHGAQGQGATGVYAALAGNRAVNLASPANLVRVVVSGGFLPATAGNPRPYGMPPFGPVLDDADIAAVVSFVRGAWGNHAAPVSALEVMHLR